MRIRTVRRPIESGEWITNMDRSPSSPVEPFAVANGPAPPWWLALLRGSAKHCPQCGQGCLFKKWIHMHDHCSGCGVRFLKDHGDPWAFLVFIDRAFLILPLIAIIFFDLMPASGVLLTLLFGGILTGIIVTTPHRYGIAVAADYLSRRFWKEPGTGAKPEEKTAPERGVQSP